MLLGQVIAKQAARAGGFDDVWMVEDGVVTEGLQMEERVFTPKEAQSAAEAFQTSASSLVMPVVRIGDNVIGDGKPGPMTRKLQDLYLEAAGIPV